MTRPARRVRFLSPFKLFVIIQRWEVWYVHSEDILLDVVRKCFDLVCSVYVSWNAENCNEGVMGMSKRDGRHGNTLVKLF